MRARSAIAVLMIVLSSVVLTLFQNCSNQDPPDFSTKSNSSSSTIPGLTMTVADKDIHPGESITITVQLSGVDKDYGLTWSVGSAADFTPSTGTKTIHKDDTSVAVTLTMTGGVAGGERDISFNIKETTANAFSATASLHVKMLPSAISVTQNYACSSIYGVTKCWGYNQWGNLGTGDQVNKSSPAAVANPNRTYTDIAVGNMTTCGISGGALYCWGFNGSYQLGDGGTSPGGLHLTATLVPGLEDGVTKVTVGWTHACAIRNGSAHCWGTNEHGQLGNNTTTPNMAPTQVFGMTSGVTDISAGYYGTCAIQNGAAKCWGYNDAGQLGDGTNGNKSLKPVGVVGATSGAAQISMGYQHACAAMSNGRARCWGQNSNGQLGDASTQSRSAAAVVPSIASGVTQVIASAYHSCAIVNGGVQCWGYNGHFNLGNGTQNNSFVPVQVTGLTAGVTHIGSGANSEITCALSGTKFACWGLNDNNQLGLGSTPFAGVPILK